MALVHELLLSLGENCCFPLVVVHSFKRLHIRVVWVNRLLNGFANHLHDLELALSARPALWLNRFSLTVMGVPWRKIVLSNPAVKSQRWAVLDQT